MAAGLVANKLGLRKILTSVGESIICIIQKATIVIGLPLSMMRGNTIDELLNVAHNANPEIIGDD